MDSVLHEATATDRIDVMEFMLEHRDEKLEVDSVDSEGRTPIHVAAREGHARVIDLCVSIGGNPNRVDCKGKTPLHYTAWKGRVKAVECLLQYSDVKCVKDKKGRTAFCVVAESEESHAHRRLVDLMGLGDALMRAARVYDGRMKSVNVLLEHGAEVDIVDDVGYTPLHCAAKAGHLQLALFLITHGASQSHLKSFPYLATYPLHLFNSFQNQCGIVPGDFLVDEMRNETVQIQFNNNDKRNLNNYSEIDNENDVMRSSTSSLPQAFHSLSVTHTLVALNFHSDKDNDEFLRESLPKFDVLVADELRNFNYYHGEDEFGKARGPDERNLDSLNEYDLGHSGEYGLVADIDRERFCVPQGYESYDHTQEPYLWEQHRKASTHGKSTLLALTHG
ncbi:uncharacterized protein HKW66_Vig0151950 [Vigna angularis]|uniref:PGG domain-containing protein n=1 Tax=Phaseolus angularis TaxID=3914 RepID=A0A8T0JTM0_PHAAN|nr:uncharacterized protein HKW66_Vig0151950 [Vigna angularis]